MIATVHHRAPSGVFLAVLVVIAILYVGWRSGRLREIGTAVGRRRALGRGRRLPDGVRVRPLALVPTLILVAVVVGLLIARS